MASATQVQTRRSVFVSGDCSHWLDRTATARQEARNLFAQIEKNGGTVESIRELIAVPPKIEQALRQYVRRHPEDAEGIEKVLSFRQRVRAEFDRLVRESESPPPLAVEISCLSL